MKCPVCEEPMKLIATASPTGHRWWRCEEHGELIELPEEKP